MNSPARRQQIEKAYAEMIRRHWGFASNGKRFGDPAATYTMVGPYDGKFVEIYGADTDCVRAVEIAIEKADRKAEANNGKV